MYRGKIKIKDNKPYRSAHYVIRTNSALGLEIQVRTLYEEDQEKIIDAIRQIFYHLKYRNTNPQTLELFLIGMGTGTKIHIRD